MSFKDKYKTKDDPNPDKKVLSDDAFAIGELLDEISLQLFRGNNGR